jgi:hypothetical protein
MEFIQFAFFIDFPVYGIKISLRWYHTLQVKFSFNFLIFFGSVFEYIHCHKYQNFNKFQQTDSEL